MNDAKPYRGSDGVFYYPIVAGKFYGPIANLEVVLTGLASIACDEENEYGDYADVLQDLLRKAIGDLSELVPSSKESMEISKNTPYKSDKSVSDKISAAVDELLDKKDPVEETIGDDDDAGEEWKKGDTDKIRPTLEDDRCEDRRIAMDNILRLLRQRDTGFLQGIAKSLNKSFGDN